MGVKEIPLRNREGEVVARALVDDDDFDAINNHRWHLMRVGYAARSVHNGGDRHIVYMHRQIMGLRRGETTGVDHINRDKLDNRRENLRRATQMQNMQNQGIRRVKKTSRFANVYWATREQKWVARTRIYGKEYWVGSFRDEEKAAVAVVEFRKKHAPYAVFA